MTLQERAAVYEELGDMFVQLDPAPEKGLDYVKDRVFFCRAMQDRVGDLLLRASRAYSEAMEARMRAQQSFEVDPKSVTKDQINNLKAEEAAHKLLVQCIKGQATLLTRTGQDIRLLADIVKDQLKRGPIDPREAKDLITDASPEEALAAVQNAGLGVPTTPVAEETVAVLGGPTGVTAQSPKPEPQPTTATLTAAPASMADFSAVLGGNGTKPAPTGAATPPVVSFVDMGKDPVEAYEPMRLPDTAAVSFDDLFSQESINGSVRGPF